MKNRSLRHTYFHISVLLFLLGIFPVDSVMGQQEENSETITINTEVVQTNYIQPKDPIAAVRVFEDSEEIKEFSITKPTDENLSIVIFLDFRKCLTKKECKKLYRLGEILSNNLRDFRNNDKPVYIINTSELALKDVHKMTAIRVKGEEVSNFGEGLVKARSYFRNQKRSRQTLLIITNKENYFSDNLQEEFESFASYVEIINTTPDPLTKWVGWNNLNMPGAMFQDNGDGLIANIQLGEYIEACNRLHVVSYQRQQETSNSDLVVKTFSKIWGEQIQKRSYLNVPVDPVKVKSENIVEAFENPELEFAPEVNETYFDQDVINLGKRIESSKIQKNDLLPVIQKTLVDKDHLNEKVIKSMVWLKEKYNWKTAFPFVVFEFDQPYIGIQNFKTMAFSTKALEILTEEELAAVTAHELAHIFLQYENESPQLEEKCDLIGYLILPRKLRPAMLKAINKLTSFKTDSNHLANRDDRLKENLAILKNEGNKNFSKQLNK